MPQQEFIISIRRRILLFILFLIIAPSTFFTVFLQKMAPIHSKPTNDEIMVTESTKPAVYPIAYDRIQEYNLKDGFDYTLKAGVILQTNNQGYRSLKVDLREFGINKTTGKEFPTLKGVRIYMDDYIKMFTDFPDMIGSNNHTDLRINTNTF
jgi:hypothetical protein